MPLPALRSRSTLGRLRRLSLHESLLTLPFLLGQPPPAASPKPRGVLRADAPGSAAPCCCGVVRADAAPSGPAGGSGVERADDGPELGANRALACQAALGPRDSASGIGAASAALACAPAGAASSAPASSPALAAKALATGACGGERVDDSAGSPGSVGVAGADVLLAGGRNSQLVLAASGALACAGQWPVSLCWHSRPGKQDLPAEARREERSAARSGCERFAPWPPQRCERRRPPRALVRTYAAAGRAPSQPLLRRPGHWRPRQRPGAAMARCCCGVWGEST